MSPRLRQENVIKSTWQRNYEHSSFITDHVHDIDTLELL